MVLPTSLSAPGATLLAAVLGALTATAAVAPGPPFSDHMVLQRSVAVPVWGTAEPGEHVVVRFAGQAGSTIAGGDGRWRIDLAPLATDARPQVLTIEGDRSPGPCRINDVLVGEVWLCGGQSNMERPLGTPAGRRPIDGADAAIAAADLPQIRELQVAKRATLDPQETAAAAWSVCSPATAPGFSAVGFFFARELWRHLRVPIGILHCSHGGSAAEAWISPAALSRFPELLEQYRIARADPRDPAGAFRAHEKRLDDWFAAHDPGSGPAAWWRAGCDASSWEEMRLPITWERAGHPAVDGVGWFQKRVPIPAAWSGRELELRLGVVDDSDTAWVNGTKVGWTWRWGAPRRYRVPAAAVRGGEAVVTVRVLDIGCDGGFTDDVPEFDLGPVGDDAARISLRGPWRCRFSVPSLDAVPAPPQNTLTMRLAVPASLYNGMLVPLAPYAIRGFAFYQGETNAARPTQYRRLFPALIADWRRTWGDERLPFLFVQLPGYRAFQPEIREAQLFAWASTRRTAMVGSIDCGDADEIHPTNKEPVGRRLADAARAVAYGEAVEYSGPIFAAVRLEGPAARVSFTHTAGGLVARGGPLRGFEAAGADGRYVPADATIDGDAVVVAAPGVRPAAVRYDWANVPDGNLANGEGLPASPFRTDPPLP